MVSTGQAPAYGAAAPDAWRTRDIVVTAVIGVAFGVVFWFWNTIWAPLDGVFALAPWAKDLLYAVWLIPAVLAPLIVRKRGAAIFAEMTAAGVSALLGSQWGPDVLLSGFVQGAAAELVFAMTLYRSYRFPTLVAAAVASAAAAWIHDWALYFAAVDPVVQLVRGVMMAISARSSWPAARCSSSARCASPASSRASRIDGRVNDGPGSIRARDLGFRHAGATRPALSDVSFEVGAGQTLLVVGPSGSGKSTLALAIAGLVPRDFDGAFEGSLEVDGIETRTWEPAALSARVGIVFQDPESQLVMERVEDDVAFGLENRGWLRGRMLARVPEALREVGLEGFERRRTSRLSGGEQQRVALGGVLAALPGILVLDEPTANLDPGGTADFFARLAAIKSRGDTSIVLVEHRVDLAWPLADLVLALDGEGRPIDLGRPEEVLVRSGVRMRREGIWLPERSPSARSGGHAGQPDRPDR